MKKSVLLSVLVLCLSLWGNAQDAKKIIEKSFTVNKMIGTESLSTLKIIDQKGRERIRKTSMATKLYDQGQTEKKIIRFLSPADVKGTGMLMFDYQDKEDNMWIYMPALRKTRRIVSSEKAKSFMGSEFTNADMVMPNLNDFKCKTVKDKEEVEGVTCWCIEMLPINDDVADEYGYSKRMVWVGHEDFVVRKAEVYDYNNELLKIMSIKKVKLVDTKNKKYQPVYLEIKNVQSNRISILSIDKIIFNPNVKDEYFTTSFLQKM